MPVVVPPRLLPKTIDVLDTGATSISLRNPNSLSKMTLMPGKNGCEKNGHAHDSGGEKVYVVRAEARKPEA